MAELPDAAALRAGVGVRVQAPGRLHLGFLDPAGTLGRRFGSLGLVVDEFETVVELRHAESDRVSAADAAATCELVRARAHLDQLRRATGCDAPLHLHVAQALPSHAGFGSGTQLALAVGRAFSTLFELSLSTDEIARSTSRGLRSGIGIAGFDRGGLLLDGGPAGNGLPAPLLARIALPQSWRVLLVLDSGAQGLSGAAERGALAELSPLPRTTAAEICHEVLMRVLAGAASAEFAPFAAGVSRVQQLLGAHFAPAQHGRAYSSIAVGRLIEWIGEHTTAAIGQSSWGPTGFAVLPTHDAAVAAVAAAREAGVLESGLSLRIVRARDYGAVIMPLAPST